MKNNKTKILREVFGHDVFRNSQEQVIDNLLAVRDALCVMPTGAGKSLCYQVPALLMKGTTIVVSPLISLMKDQVRSLLQSGVRAAYLNSSLTIEQYYKALRYATKGIYKIIYVAPERLHTDSFMNAASQMDISMVAVDEAHCVSQWGQDFRPSYLQIPDFISHLPKRPVVGAFTATATSKVKNDIARMLELNNPFSVTAGFDRPNLYFGVRKPHDKKAELLQILHEHKKQSGIVYCSTRKAVEAVCEFLVENGFSATRYHAGLSAIERKTNQEHFVFDKKRIIVATNAFGMGIDKSNVSFVIHYNMPKDIESYYQEAGRAGRDGSNADCILLYSPRDVYTNRYLIEHSEPNPNFDEKTQLAVRENDQERLKLMTFYCTTNCCLRAFILRYFGDNAKSYCNNCSSCIVKKQAQKQTTSEKSNNIQYNENLFEELKKLRAKLASINGLPPYVVFFDSTLTEMCRRLPKSEQELLAISGVGETKAKRYGKAFLKVIAKYLEEGK